MQLFRGVLITLLAVAAALVLVWLVVTFHRWILMGLALLLISWLRGLFGR